MWMKFHDFNLFFLKSLSPSHKSVVPGLTDEHPIAIPAGILPSILTVCQCNLCLFIVYKLLPDIAKTHIFLLLGHSSSLLNAIRELMEKWIPHLAFANDILEVKSAQEWIFGKLLQSWKWPIKTNVCLTLF